MHGESDPSDAPTLVDDATTTLGRAPPLVKDMTREGESGPFARVALIQGRSPPPAPEIAELLQRRLRVGAQLIVMAIGLFFVRDYLLGQRPQNLWMRVGMLVVVVALFAYLHPRQLSMRQARIAEMFGFGILIAWFSHNEYVHLLGWARQGEQSAVLFTLTSEVLAFYVVMSGYAMFIPNTWRRALLICGSMALVPFATLGVIRAFHPDEFDVIAASIDVNNSSFLAVLMVAGVLIASAGAHVIHTLRRQVAAAKRLGQYHLREKIGEGGMGEVWKADHRFLARPAAIKLIKAAASEGEERWPAEVMLQSFEREVQATAMLRSVHTIEVYDFGATDDGTFYYVMELLDGFDLRTLVERFGPLPPARVVHVLLQVCDSLSEAHAAGLIHRDLKPANIFACRMGTAYDFVKVLDFGLVQVRDEQGVERALSLDAGRIVGTPAFMSPEAALGHEQDPRSDIYSLACVGFWLLTGRLLFDADTPSSMAVKQAQAAPVAPSTRFTDIDLPGRLESLLLTCLDKDPSNRPVAVDDVAHSLRQSGIGDAWTQARARDWWKTHG